jgi:hypothetical protein
VFSSGTIRSLGLAIEILEPLASNFILTGTTYCSLLRSPVSSRISALLTASRGLDEEGFGQVAPRALLRKATSTKIKEQNGVHSKRKETGHYCWQLASRIASAMSSNCVDRQEEECEGS